MFHSCAAETPKQGKSISTLSYLSKKTTEGLVGGGSGCLGSFRVVQAFKQTNRKRHVTNAGYLQASVYLRDTTSWVFSWSLGLPGKTNFLLLLSLSQTLSFPLTLTLLLMTCGICHTCWQGMPRSLRPAWTPADSKRGTCCSHVSDSRAGWQPSTVCFFFAYIYFFACFFHLCRDYTLVGSSPKPLICYAYQIDGQRG